MPSSFLRSKLIIIVLLNFFFLFLYLFWSMSLFAYSFFDYQFVNVVVGFGAFCEIETVFDNIWRQFSPNVSVQYFIDSFFHSFYFKSRFPMQKFIVFIKSAKRFSIELVPYLLGVSGTRAHFKLLERNIMRNVKYRTYIVFVAERLS